MAASQCVSACGHGEVKLLRSHRADLWKVAINNNISLGSYTASWLLTLQGSFVTFWMLQPIKLLIRAPITAASKPTYQTLLQPSSSSSSVWMQKTTDVRLNIKQSLHFITTETILCRWFKLSRTTGIKWAVNPRHIFHQLEFSKHDEAKRGRITRGTSQCVL